MSESPIKWKDVISIVQKANLEATANLKYIEAASEKIRRKQQQISARREQDLQERKKIEQKIKRQEELQRITKEMRIKKQKQYLHENYESIKSHQSSTIKQPIYPQHPFARLADDEQKRKQVFKSHLRKQNQMNMMQSQIKLKESNETRQRQKQYRQKYVNHVEAFYLKKIEDRNIFKSKYLKLSNPQKSQFLPSVPLDTTIDKQYESINKSIMKQSKLKKIMPQEIDSTLRSINKKIQIPDSSPAYLGRIPINSDRKRQLDYLQRSALKNDTKRLKTQGDGELKIVESRRFTTQNHQFSALQDYYNKVSSKSFLRNNTQSMSPEPIKNQANKSPERFQSIRIPEVGVKTVQRSNNIQPLRNIRAQSRQKKVFSTYDIIQNKRKYTYL